MATLPTDAKRNWESEKSVTNCLWGVILPLVLRVIFFTYKPILVLHRWLTGAANERGCIIVHIGIRYYDSGDVSKTCESCVVLFTWSKTLQQLVRLLFTMCGSLRKGNSLGWDTKSDDNYGGKYWVLSHGSSLSRRDRITNLKTSSQIISIKFWEGLVSLWCSCNIQLARKWLRIRVYNKVVLDVVYL